MASDGNDQLGDKLDGLVELLHNSESTTRLTHWEANFMDELRDRVVQYGARTYVSAKQWAIIERIEHKIYQ